MRVTVTRQHSPQPFTGDSGTYDITLGYHDEQDGVATLTTSIAGQQISTLSLDAPGLGTQPTATNFMTSEIGTGVQVNTGDTIEITGVQGNWDHANVDYIEFVSTTAPPPVPAVTLTADNANEGDNILFNVNLSEVTTVDVAVDYVVDHPGGANSASSNDYTATSGTLTVPAGTTTGTVSVATTEDSSAEQDELIRITVSNPTNATLTDTTRQATIFDDDLSASFWINDVSVTEGGNLTFTVTKAGSTVLTHAVNYTTANGTAAAGSDYSTVSGTLSFSPSETSETVIVFTTQDTVFEANETLYVNLSNPSSGATVSDGQGVGTINNDDTAPSFSINDVSATEGGNLTFTVTKTGSTVLTHAVNYTTANGTAVAGSDYSAVSGTLSFAPSESSETITVSTTQETAVEPNETLYVNLSSPSSGATVSDGQGVGTINNDDAALDAVDDSVFYQVDCCLPDQFVYPLNNDSGINPTITSITQPIGSGITATLATSSSIRLSINPGQYSGWMTYTITDANGGSDTATIFIETEEIN